MASWLTQSSVVSVLFLIFFVATFLSMKWCLIACHTYRCRLRTYSFSFSDSDLAFVSNLRNIIFIWTQLYYRQYLNTHNRQVHHPYIRIRHAFSNIIRLVVFFFVLELFVSKFIQIITIQSIYTCPFGISLVNLFANTILVIYMYIKFFVFFFSELWKNESRFVVLGWLMGLSVISLKFHVHWFTDCFSCMIDFAPIHWIQYVYWIIWIFLQYNILKCGSNVCLHELQYNQCGLLSFIFFLLNVVAVDELAPKLI